MTAAIKVCETCYYWSDQMARIKDDTLQAVCLSSRGYYQMDYTNALHRCRQWKDAEHGSIDDPDRKHAVSNCA